MFTALTENNKRISIDEAIPGESYNLFVKFTNMPLTAEGSLNSFTDNHNKLDEELADKLKELDIYFD